jgi:hypothetical protein
MEGWAGQRFLLNKQDHGKESTHYSNHVNCTQLYSIAWSALAGRSASILTCSEYRFPYLQLVILYLLFEEEVEIILN